MEPEISLFHNHGALLYYFHTSIYELDRGFQQLLQSTAAKVDGRMQCKFF